MEQRWRRRQPTAPFRRTHLFVEPPLSPWADRFYPNTMPYSSIDEDGVLHSSLAPYWPHLSINDLPEMARMPNLVVPLPHMEALDRLFLDERLQNNYLGGFRTWQVPALNSRPGPYGPDHHVPKDGNDLGWNIFKDSAFERTERSWLTFYARERWLDYRVPCFETIQFPIVGLDHHPNNWWTVDNQHIWNQLCVPIEIANRILEQLIAERDPWIDAVMFQPIEYWRDFDPHVLAAYMRDNNNNPFFIRMEPDINKRQFPEVIRNQMCTLLTHTMWTFFDEHLDMGLGATWPLANVTPLKPGSVVPCNLITIQTACLRSLCNSNLSLVERVNVQMALAGTILHETMHALWMGRLIVEKGSTHGYEEPYVWPLDGPPETIREMGFSFEKHIFGGTIQIQPQPLDPYKWKGRPLLLTMSTWPLYNTGTNLPPQLWQNEVSAHNIINYPVPASWSAVFSTKEFWIEVVPFFRGKAAFLAPKIFRSEQHRDWYTIGRRAYGAKRMRLDDQDWYADKYEWAHQVWQDRQRHWNMLRPWYHEEYQIWSATPWSMVEARTIVERFVEAHAIRDQAQCVKQSEYLTRHINAYNANSRRGPLTWVYIVIGLLMRAATPLMTHDAPDCYPPRNPGVNIYPNSRGVPGPFAVRGVRPGDLSFDLSMIYIDEFQLFNIIPRSNWVSSALSLQEAQTLANSERNLVPVPEPWLRMIDHIWTELSNWVTTNGEPTLVNWPDFNLEIPAYDHDLTWSNGHDILTNREHSPLASPTNITMAQSFTSLPEPDGPLFGALLTSAKGGTAGPRQSRTFADTDRYFTVGEVADHIGSDKCARIVEPDGNCGFYIYDITAYCKEAGFAEGKDIRDHLMHLGEYGPSLIHGRNKLGKSIKPWVRNLVCRRGADYDHELLDTRESPEARKLHAALGSKIHPIGKLRTRKRPEEIAEYNGEDGMPFWLLIRGSAYDLTNLTTSHRDRDVLRFLVEPARYKSLDVSEGESERMLRRLQRHKCANVQGKPYKWMPQLKPYTLETLARCDNPTYGCYTAIGEDVYDLKPYLDHHPGGRQILLKCLGGEATEFWDWHSSDILGPVNHLRIGRLVPDMEMNFVEEHEVVIHGWVFDISRLAPDQSKFKVDHDMYEHLAKLGGQDLSEAIKKDDVTGSAVSSLYQKGKRLIVGKIKSDRPLREIPQGELYKHCEANTTTCTWVAVKGQVYDVTTIMIHGKSFYEHTIPDIWAGRELGDEILAEWLTENYPHYVIGKLVPGEAWPEPELPNQEELEAAERERKEEQLRRKGKFPDNLIPEDIVKWATKTSATPAEYRHQMALRFGWYEDSQPDDPVKPCIKLNADGTNACPKYARPLRLRTAGDGGTYM